MVEKIFVSITEVMRYEWLNTYKVEVEFVKNSITRDPLFRRTIERLIKSGLKTFLSNSGETKINFNEDCLCVSFEKEDDIAIFSDVCEWIITNDLSYPDPQKDVAVFYSENKGKIVELFKEIKQILTNKPSEKYQRHYECVDGMN